MSTRDEIIAGLHELADWLAANPEVPVRALKMRYSVSNDQPSDEASMAELHRIAALIGAEVAETYKGAHFDAEKRFRGGVSYQAGVIFRREMVDHDERWRLGREAFERQRAAGGGSDA